MPSPWAFRLAVVALPIVMTTAACSNPNSGGTPEETTTPTLPTDPTPLGDWGPSPDQVGGLARLAFTRGEELVTLTGSGERTFIAGVNLGPTIPGYFPGEQAIRAEDFRRWFPQMAQLGLRAIRVYTIMPPSFYDELVTYNNANPQAPLYVVHGVWIPEEEFFASQDLFAPVVYQGFKDEIERAVGVVHGDIELPDRPGHAFGVYNSDISPWLLSWSIGVEWDPIATAASDRHNADARDFAGEFFQSVPGASATEKWIAEMLDHLAGLEVERGVTMPLTFVNWPTTDPLHHPDEPLEREDLVGVDASNIAATDSWPGGYFASYHAYPYYPDFQRYEEGIVDFEFQGRIDPYAGYLDALRRHHEGMPVVITEFGVPSGMAHAHFGPLGRNQGDHSEQEQMAINAELLEVIEGVGLSGGFFFQWADEWFKFTWNTIDYELPPERRALWMNPWTNEAHFGLVAVEPGDSPTVIIDGDDAEWATNGSQVIWEGRGPIREVAATRDEGFLYLRLVTDQPEAWLRDPIRVGFDLIPGGNGGLPGLPGHAPEADYALTIGEEGAVVWVRGANNPFLIQYGLVRGYVDFEEADLDSWSPQRLIVNRPLTIPSTGKEMAAEVIEVGALRHGTSDPTDPSFDSRTSWHGAGKVIEVRLPFQAIGFADPSSRQALVVDLEGNLSTSEVSRLGITVVAGGEDHVTNGYAWEPWQLPSWHERLKAGSETLRSAIVAANSRP